MNTYRVYCEHIAAERKRKHGKRRLKKLPPYDWRSPQWDLLSYLWWRNHRRDLAFSILLSASIGEDRLEIDDPLSLDGADELGETRYITDFVHSIDTAPKNGTPVLVMYVGNSNRWDDNRMIEDPIPRVWWATRAYFDVDYEYWTDGQNRLIPPTHWMFLPFGVS